MQCNGNVTSKGVLKKCCEYFQDFFELNGQFRVDIWLSSKFNCWYVYCAHDQWMDTSMELNTVKTVLWWEQLKICSRYEGYHGGISTANCVRVVRSLAQKLFIGTISIKIPSSLAVKHLMVMMLMGWHGKLSFNPCLTILHASSEYSGRQNNDKNTSMNYTIAC